MWLTLVLRFGWQTDLMKILMVCTGNICRSPAAEVVARRALDEAGLQQVGLDSAGTGDWHEGEPAHHHTRQVGQRRGYSVTHRARAVRRSDFREFDLFIAMDKSHARWLHDRVSEASSVVLLRSLDPSCGATTPLDDPYGHDIEVFENMYDQIELAMPGLVALVRVASGDASSPPPLP